MGIFDQQFDGQMPQFGGNATPYQLDVPDYNSLNGFSFGNSPYASAANGMQVPTKSFGDFMSPGAGGAPSLWDSFLGAKGKDGMTSSGWGGMALGAAQGLAGAYMGMKNYGLAKDSLAQGKKQFQMNYDAQKTTTNTALEDRQRARVANNPNSVAVADYMNKNRIA